VFEHVVVGATDSESGTRAVRRALELVRASGGTLHVVAALAPKEGPAPSVPEEFRYTDAGAGQADWVLSQARAHAGEAQIRVTTHPVLADPVQALTKVAAEERADLIVVGCGHHGDDRRLSGIDQAVMDRADCAVLVVRAVWSPDPAVPPDLWSFSDRAPRSGPAAPVVSPPAQVRGNPGGVTH
jgi:nucleotide-binding universal stress UspA family protein